MENHKANKALLNINVDYFCQMSNADYFFQICVKTQVQDRVPFIASKLIEATYYMPARILYNNYCDVKAYKRMPE